MGSADCGFGGRLLEVVFLAGGPVVVRLGASGFSPLLLCARGTWQKEHVSMVRKIQAKLILQLRAVGLSGRVIAVSQSISRRSIAAVIDAADRAGVDWDGIAEKSDDEVYDLLFPGRGQHHSVFIQPDWDKIHQELARVGVTLKLLHGEDADKCAATSSPAMGYDRFCRTYQRHVMVTGAASRVGHKAAQSVEVDWSGPTMTLEDSTGGSRKVYLFVGCLPFSRYAFGRDP